MSLDLLKKRLQFNGGNQEGRMIEGKLKALKKALIHSYQAETAILADGREFRCLINPDKLKMDYEDKIISIPFEDICLNKERVGTTTEGLEEIDMKPGDVFTWKETDTYWLVYLRRYEENAYFRAEIRKCDYDITINDNNYKVYIAGPSKARIDWMTKSTQGGVSWNNLNYDAMMYLTKNEETEDYFHRFSKINVCGKNWEVVMVDKISTEGVLQVALKEDFTNSVADAAAAEKQPEPEVDTTLPYIDGDAIVYPYDEKSYVIQNASNGTWAIEDKSKATIINQTSQQADIVITTGRSGQFKLLYQRENEDDIVLNVTIESL